jgi:hypothetical protein
MTPCLSCHRHVREEICPFCGSECVQPARSSVGRVARTALFAASAVVLSECSSSPSPQPMYGASCVPLDACAAPADASKEAASDGGPKDAAEDAPEDATID